VLIRHVFIRIEICQASEGARVILRWRDRRGSIEIIRDVDIGIQQAFTVRTDIDLVQ
jgi:hypothetical protein